MEQVKESGEFQIFKKRSGRFCIKNKSGKYVNGEEKTKILLDNKLIKIDPPKKKEEAPAEEAPAEETSAE